jgi:hypothetical protein
VITVTLAIDYFLPYSQFVEEERPHNDQQQGKGNIGKLGNAFNVHESIEYSIHYSYRNSA